MPPLFTPTYKFGARGVCVCAFGAIGAGSHCHRQFQICLFVKGVLDGRPTVYHLAHSLAASQAAPHLHLDLLLVENYSQKSVETRAPAPEHGSPREFVLDEVLYAHCRERRIGVLLLGERVGVESSLQEKRVLGQGKSRGVNKGGAKSDRRRGGY